MHTSTYQFFTYVLPYTSCKTGAPRKNVKLSPYRPRRRRDGDEVLFHSFLISALNGKCGKSSRYRLWVLSDFHEDDLVGRNM